MTTKIAPRASFTILNKQMTQINTAERLISSESVFWSSTKVQRNEQIAIQQSHIINPLLTLFALSGRESIAFGFYRKTSDNTFPYRPRNG